MILPNIDPSFGPLTTLGTVILTYRLVRINISGWLSLYGLMLDDVIIGYFNVRRIISVRRLAGWLISYKLVRRAQDAMRRRSR